MITMKITMMIAMMIITMIIMTLGRQAAEKGESKQVDGEAAHHTIAIIQVPIS